MAEDLKKMYRTIMDDPFPARMEVSFVDESPKHAAGIRRKRLEQNRKRRRQFRS